MLPHIEVRDVFQAVVKAIGISVLCPDACGDGTHAALYPLLRHHVPPGHKTLRGNLSHAVVSGKDEVDAVPVREGLKAKIQGMHEAVHLLCHILGLRGEGAVDVSLMVRFVEIAHHKARALCLRETHQADNFITAL